uniref:L1 transposable element RRM domain-containing protein n=1 Tax=Micrurus carvalhoi TaxID=3147026 RepID=A0A2H6N7L5_9SAUR
MGNRSEFYLRFQNVKEEKGKHLAEIMTKILAEALEITEKKMMDGMKCSVSTQDMQQEIIYQEKFILDLRRKLLKHILQVEREKILKYKDKEIVVLKQVPRTVREIRREYFKELLKRGVNYRWLIPEGLLFTWQEQRQN